MYIVILSPSLVLRDTAVALDMVLMGPGWRFFLLSFLLLSGAGWLVGWLSELGWDGEAPAVAALVCSKRSRGRAKSFSCVREEGGGCCGV